MCGLAGVLTVKSTGLAGNIKSMTSTLDMRGPDAHQTWFDPAKGIALGHRRLAILDLSRAGHQPMQSECGRYVIVFNGEVYNHLVLRSQLEAVKSIAWRGHSDTETIVEYVAQYGFEQTLKALKGMFSIAIWDIDSAELLMARDRFGEKPFYYGWQNSTFIFGSELKALKAYSDFKFTICRKALALFVRYNYVPSPHSIYKDVYKLAPGHFLRVSTASVEVTPKAYWDLPSEAKAARQNLFSGSFEEAALTLEQKLMATIESQMLSDVPIGALLSGGIDSSLVSALMQQCKPTPIETFTIGFDNKNFNEAEHAKAVAQQIGSYHTELYLSASDAMSLIPSLPQVYDEPFADSSQLPTILAMRLAKKNVSVALSGDGADELFGGYNRYIFGPNVIRRFGAMSHVNRKLIARLLRFIKAEQLNRVSRPLIKSFGVAQLGDKAHKLAACLPYAGDITSLYDSLVSQWSNQQVVKMDADAKVEPAHSILTSFQLDDSISSMMLADSARYLPDDILVKVDRAAMSVSLETRAPFLDHELAQFAWSLPNTYKVSSGVGKVLLRELLYRHVPKVLVDRPKVGFSVPLDEWLRGPLRSWADDLLSERRLEQEGYFYVEPIRKSWQDHVSGKASNGYKLWSILMFQSWLEAQ